MSLTTNQPAVADEGEYSVRRTIRIAAPLEKVWSAVTDPVHVSTWFGRTELDGTDAGATGTMTFDDGGAIPLRIEAVDPMRLVSYRWNNDDALARPPKKFDDATSTVFSFTLEPTSDGTQLTVVETGFDRTSNPAANLASHVDGWTAELDKLVALLETAS